MNVRLAGIATCLVCSSLAVGAVRTAGRAPRANADQSDTGTNPADPILETCSETDQFTFTDIGTIMDATRMGMGVAVGSPIADHTKVLLPDGRLRLYFQYLAKDFSYGTHYSAISSDGGVTFTLEKKGVFADNEWRDPFWGPHVKAKWLADGRLRIYKGATPAEPANTGIISYVTSDGLTFTKEDGFRITPSQAGLSGLNLSHLSIVSTSDGKYRGYFSNHPKDGDSRLLVKSAASSDLLTWTVDEGVRVGTGASVPAVADYSAEQVHALQRAGGCVTLFYATTRYQGNKAGGLRYSTSRDGVTFSTQYLLRSFGNGPDIVKRADGTYLLSYDAGNENDGFDIRIGKLELVRRFVRGAGGIDFNDDGAADVFLYNVSTGARSLELSTRAGGFSRTLDSWDRGWQVFPADLDGDRIADVFLYDPVRGAWVQAISSGGTMKYTSGTWDTRWQVFTADLDGDGLTDAFLYDFTDGVWVKCFSDGAGGFRYVSGRWDPGWELYRADMNGDGRDDFFLDNATTGRHLRSGLDRKDRRQRGESRTGPEQRQALAGWQRPARDDGAGGHVLESRQQGVGQLHGEGDVQRTEVHEPERSPAPVRDHDRGQRSRHAAAELSVLRGLRQRHLHRAWVRSRALSDGRPPAHAARRRAQGCRAGAGRGPGDCDVREGRPRRMCDQQHGRSQLHKGRTGRPREAQVHRRHLRDSLRPQHRRHGQRPRGDEALERPRHRSAAAQPNRECAVRGEPRLAVGRCGPQPAG